MNAPHSSTVVLLVLIPLFAWRMYKRFRRLVGRQRLSKIRLGITLVLYPAVVVLLCFASRTSPGRLGWLAGGLGMGCLLGLYGLVKTRFEPTPKGLFYTPHAHLGIALSLLLVGRIAYRFIQVYGIEATGPQGMHDFARTPLTLAVFGLLAAYYITYAIGLVRWRFRLVRAKQLREAMESESQQPVRID
jgi:hypothetical protein